MALVATTWGLAVAANWTGSTTAAVAAFAAVALVPGALLDRQRTGDRLTRVAELPARALTLSVGITTISGGIAALAGWPIVFVPGCLLGVSILLALAPSTPNHNAADSPPNAPDLNHRFIIALLALNKGAYQVVRASITGSILGNLLLLLGLAMFAGGIKHKTQKFSRMAVEGLDAVLMSLQDIAKDYNDEDMEILSALTAGESSGISKLRQTYLGEDRHLDQQTKAWVLSTTNQMEHLKQLFGAIGENYGKLALKST